MLNLNDKVEVVHLLEGAPEEYAGLVGKIGRIKDITKEADVPFLDHNAYLVELEYDGDIVSILFYEDELEKISKYSLNATKYFTEEELDQYAEKALESKEYCYYPDEPLQAVWLDDTDKGERANAICRGNYIIAENLTELEADILLDELQAICEE